MTQYLTLGPANPLIFNYLDVMFHKEHLTTPYQKFYIPPYPYCVHGRVAYSMSQPPIRFGMLGCPPRVSVAGPRKSMANLDKRKCLTPCHNPLSPSHNPFNILDIFYSQLKLKQNGVKFQSTRSTCTNCFIR